MKYSLLLPVVAAMGLCTATGRIASADDAQLPDGVLTWTNGDTLPGRLLDATASHLRWQSPAFQAPFELDIRYLASARFPSSKQASKPTEPHRFVLQSGDVIYGELVGKSGDDFLIRSQRHGDFQLHTTALRGIQRLDSTSLVYSGPVGFAGWKTISRGRTLKEWTNTEDGYLTTKGTGSELFRQAQLPPVAEIEIGLRWSGKPGFLITFATPKAVRFSTESAKLETWEDELVLQTLETNGDFLKLRTLTEETKQLQLRLYWDQNAGELAVYSQQGELLGRMTTPTQNVTADTGLYLQNKGDDLTVTHLRISTWNGGGPKDLEAGKTRIQLVDGESVVGHIESLDKTTGKLVVQAENGPQELELAKVAGIYLTDARSPAGVVPPLKVVFQDGEVLRGQLISIAAGIVSVQTEYSGAPITARLDNASAITLHTPEKLPADGAHLMTYEGGKLRGQLAESGPDGKTLGWRPVGSATSTPLGADCRARITASPTAAAAEEGPERSDVVYLRNGDIVPCRLEGIDETHVLIAAPYCASTRIPQELVKAIELSADVQHLPTGFDGVGWVVNEREEGTVERDNQQAVFNGPATLGHPTILRGDTLQFDASWSLSSPSAVNMSFFTREGNRSKQPQLLVYFAGQQVIVRGMQNGIQNVFNRPAAQRKGDAKLKFAFLEDRVDVYIDDNKVVSQPIPETDRDGNGLVMAVQRLNQGDRTKKMLTLSNLRIGRTGGALSSLRIDDQQKEIVLTVPRQRKKTPPTHVLVASTGDLLRGRLTGLTGDKVHFNSRLEDLAVDRNRLAGIIWLDPPSGADVAESNGTPNTANSDPSSAYVAKPDPVKADPVKADPFNANPDNPATAFPVAASPGQEVPDSDVENGVEPGSAKGHDSLRVLLSNGAIISFTPQGVGGGKILGTSGVLGECGIPFSAVHELHLGHYVQVDVAYADWKLHAAKEPQFDTAAGAGGTNSSLVGTTANGFAIPLLKEGRFELGQHSDKIVILDFWATWCGPCVKALPELIAVAQEFPADKVLLVAVNQQENEQTIHEFLATRDWKVQVALDRDGKIGRRFQVDAIPQTVLIGPGLKIERVFVGSRADTAAEIRAAVQKLVGDLP